MKLTTEQLAPHLEKGLRPLYVVSGDEPLGVMEALDSIRHQARCKGYTDREVFHVERHFNWQQLKASSQSLSLFSSLRLVEINLLSGKPGVEGSKALQEYAQDLPPDTITLIRLPAIDKPSQKSNWFIALEEAGVLISAVSVELDKLPAWIARRLAAQGQQTDQPTLEFIAQQVEGNLLAAHQEIQKLGLLYPQGRLSADEVRSAVLNVTRYDAFQLGDALLQGDLIRANQVLEGLKAEGMQPVVLLGTVTWLLRGALRVKLAITHGLDVNSAFAQAKIWGDRQRVMQQALSRISLNKLQSAFFKLAEIDKINKGLVKGDAWLEISRLCYGLARSR